MIRFLEAIKKYENGHRPLYHFALVIFLWAVVDGIISFSIPIYLQEAIKNLALVGFVFSLSSCFGLFWDLYLGSQQKGRVYKSYLWQGFLLTALMCFLIFKFSGLWWFVVMMAVWGFYFENIWFGTFDFLDRFAKRWEHAESFGLVQMLRSAGYVLGPVIGGLAVFLGKGINMGIAFFLLLVGMGFFWTWFHKGEKRILHDEPPKKRLTKGKEVKLWLKVGKKAFWALIGIFLINLWDSLVWFMGPIFLTLHQKGGGGSLAGLTMASFVLPTVIVPGLAGRWADKKGRKGPMFLGFLLAGVFLALFGMGQGALIMMIWALFSAGSISLTIPAVNGLFVDAMAKVKIEDEEIVGARGVASSLGFIIGPVVAGFLGVIMEARMVFAIFGMMMILGAGIIGFFWKGGEAKIRRS